MSLARLARIPTLGLIVFALARTPGTPAPAPAPVPSDGSAPAPPNGTYTYALSRNGGSVGTTTVVIERRDDTRELETDEAGAAAAAHVHLLGWYRYADLGVAAYAGTYQAPFLRDSSLGRVDKYRPAPDFYGQTTVRYRARPGALVASIDGTPIVDVLGTPTGSRSTVRAPWIFDAPFMTGALLLPAFRHRTSDALLVPVSEAFPSGVDSVTQRLVRATPSSPKTPKTDLAVDVPGVARIWFDPKTYIVHEAHFAGVNFDARLVSYVRGGFTAPFLAQTAPAAMPALPAEAVTFASQDGTSLSASLARPANGKTPLPAVVLVPPGPGASLDYDAQGPTPLFPALAAALVQRGYAVLRYDMRGVGKSGETVAGETWDQAVTDAEAALALVAGDERLDPKRIYVLGYGNGADVALAAAGSASARLAGAIALAPTVVAYRACAAAVGPAVPAVANDAAWRKSALAHDPSVLAARARAPLLVFHPGLPVCNEGKDQLDAYDDKLRSANRSATIVAARDLTQRFGSRYEAEAPRNTEEFFPYRFDASTAGAIADWLDNPKVAGASYGIPAGSPAKPPPAPPGVDERGTGLPNPHASAAAGPAPERSVEPGIVLPGGVTPPPLVAPPPTATPVPTPRPQATPAPAASVPVSPPAATSPASPAASPA